MSAASCRDDPSVGKNATALHSLLLTTQRMQLGLMRECPPCDSSAATASVSSRQSTEAFAVRAAQAALLQSIGHPERALRRTVGSSVAAVVAAAGLAAWPELVPALAAGLGAADLATLEGSLDCLHKVPRSVRSACCWLAARMSVVAPRATVDGGALPARQPGALALGMRLIAHSIRREQRLNFVLLHCRRRSHGWFAAYAQQNRASSHTMLCLSKP